MIYLANIRTNLSYFCEKSDAGHPLVETQARLASKVVQVRYQTLHDVFEARVATLRIYAVHIFRDIFNGEIFEDRHRRGVCTLRR